METITERDDNILIFDILSDQHTAGTSYDYYKHFPNFDEEMFYVLECATRQNADPEEIIKVCKEVKAQRDEMLLQRFNNSRAPDELEIDLSDLDYGINDDTRPVVSQQ